MNYCDLSLSGEFFFQEESLDVGIIAPSHRHIFLLLKRVGGEAKRGIRSLSHFLPSFSNIRKINPARILPSRSNSQVCGLKTFHLASLGGLGLPSACSSHKTDHHQAASLTSHTSIPLLKSRHDEIKCKPLILYEKK